MRVSAHLKSVGGSARPSPSRLMAVALMLSAAYQAGAADRASAADAKNYPLTLSTPVALAQTGPNGTLMSFGCEYQFDQGARRSQARYVVVIKNGKGKTATIALKLEEHGMAGVLVDGWRPGDRPFSGYFAEQINKSSQPGKPELRPISAEIEFPLDPNQE